MSGSTAPLAGRCSARGQPVELMCNKGKKRVRNPDRYPTKEERTERERAARAAIAGCRSQPRREAAMPVVDLLLGVVSVFQCDASAQQAVKALQNEVDAQRAGKWKTDDLNCLAKSAVLRRQLHCKSIMTHADLQGAARMAARAVCASAPPCPRCGNPMSSHVVRECDVNQYPMGSGLCVHLDSDPGVALLVAMPGKGVHGGGLLRVAPLEGEDAMCVRSGAASMSSVPLKRARDLVHVPLPPLHGCVFDGHRHFHEISEVTHGSRYSFTVGFEPC